MSTSHQLINCIDFYYDKCHALTYMCKDCPDRKTKPMVEVITDTNLLKEIIWDDAEGYERIKDEITDKGRWHVIMETVFRRASDNKLFIMYWRSGATENQEHEYPDEAVEAEEVTMTVVNYREIPREKKKSKPVSPPAMPPDASNNPNYYKKGM